MLDDMDKQDNLYKPTPFWQIGSDMIIKDLNENGLQDFRALEKALGFFVPTYSFSGYHTDKKELSPVTDLLWSIIKPDKRLRTRLNNLFAGKSHALADYRTFMASSIDSPPYTDLISESNIGNPIEQFEFNGRHFSRSFLNYLLGINFIKKNNDTSGIKTVMEIGGGFGTLCEILLGDKRNDCFYINVDIPPLAFVSGYYLKNVFGDHAIGTYDKTREAKTLDIDVLKKEYKALNLCSWQIPKLKGKIDLFVNFISFQEMEPRIVENYCRHIRRLRPDFILLRNIKEGKRTRDKEYPGGVIDPILGDDYNNFFPEYELVDTNTTIFGYETEDGFHSELRFYRHLDT